LFDNLAPGEYQVQVSDIPTIFIPTPNQNTSDDDDTATDSNIPVGAAEASDILVAGDDADDVSDADGNATIDFGFIAPLSVGSLVWEDLNGDGVQDSNEPPIAGVFVELFISDGAGGLVAATDLNGNPVSATTGPDGLYEFDNLPQGTYVIPKMTLI